MESSVLLRVRVGQFSQQLDDRFVFVYGIVFEISDLFMRDTCYKDF